MLYETVWLFFALGVGILISIGLLGLIFSPSIPPPILRAMAMIISVGHSDRYLFLLPVERRKKGIQVLTQQAEETIKQYLATHQKK